MELFDCAIAIFRSQRPAWFPLLSACRLAEFDTSVICANTLFRLISITKYVLRSPSIASRGTKFEMSCEHVASSYSATSPLEHRAFFTFFASSQVRLLSSLQLVEFFSM